MESNNNFAVSSLTTSYTNNPTGIPEKLKNRPKWLTSLLDEYDLTDWCFYGYVGSGDDITGVAVLFQKKMGKYTAVLGVYQPGIDSEWNLSASVYVPLIVDPGTSSAPWSVEGIEFLNIKGKNKALELGGCKVTLLGGAFGEPGAKYQIQGRVFGSYELNLDVEMTDNLGAFNVGYGPASFLPNYLFEDQFNTLNNEEFNGNLEKYLKIEAPKLSNQGSYYFSSAMEVTKYNIIQKTKKGSVSTNENGANGFIWFDSVTQNFGELNHLPDGASVSWHWVAIPNFLPGVALAATKLVYKGDQKLNLQDVSSAALYAKNNLQGERWSSNEIFFKNQPSVNGQVREFTLIMGKESAPNYVSLSFKALPGNQTVFGGATEGNYLVTGTFGEKNITEADKVYAWCEMGYDERHASNSRLFGFRKAVEKRNEIKES